LLDSQGLEEMKTYIGARTIDGIKVTVDGQQLDERIDIHQFTDNGFEWTYEGDAPQQLALSGEFMKQVIAELDNEWSLTSTEIDAALNNKNLTGEQHGGSTAS